MRRQVPAHPVADGWWARAARVIPCGTQTLSKAPSQFVEGVYPKYLTHGRGCRVVCADGHEYLDYPMALGAILLGHAHPRVVEAVERQARAGTLFTLMHPLEVEVAERLVDLVPCAEMVRFMKSGSDATSAAVRLARAVTGRERVAFAGYHGWHDWYAGTTPLSAGVPAGQVALAHAFDADRPTTLAALLDAHPGEFAAVILEQGLEEPAIGALAAVRGLADRHGAIFIWDEIVTGLRWAPGGAQARYGVVPDLACFGKALGNGLPISAVVGRRDLMEAFTRVFVSMTHGGDVLALAAARAVLDEVRDQPVVPHLWSLGARWLAGMRAIAASSGVAVAVRGVAPRSQLVFADQGGCSADVVRSLFLQECLRRGVLFGVPIFMSWAHGEAEIARTIEIAGEALALVRAALDAERVEAWLEGRPAGQVFRPAPGSPEAGAERHRAGRRGPGASEGRRARSGRALDGPPGVE